MAKLRGITKEIMTNVNANLREYEIIINEGEQYEKADELMKKFPNIIYVNYWDDEDMQGGGQLTYSITREDIEYNNKYFLKK